MSTAQLCLLLALAGAFFGATRTMAQSTAPTPEAADPGGVHTTTEAEDTRAETLIECDARALYALLRQEPTLEQLLAGSVHIGDTAIVEERRRLRRAHMLPTRARLTGGMRVDREDESRLRVVQGFEGLDPDDATIEDRTTSDRDLFVDLGLSLEWRLDQLVRDDREVEIVREVRRQHDAARAQQRRLIELYYERRELLAGLCEQADGMLLEDIFVSSLYVRLQQTEAELALLWQPQSDTNPLSVDTLLENLRAQRVDSASADQ